MALYEYRCPDCGAAAELLVWDGETPACPKCGSTRLEKQMSTFAVNAPAGRGGSDTPSCGSGGCASGNCPFA